MGVFTIDSNAMFSSSYEQGLISPAVFSILKRCDHQKINGTLMFDESILNGRKFSLHIIAPDNSYTVNESAKDTSDRAVAICNAHNTIKEAVLQDRIRVLERENEYVQIMTWPIGANTPLQTATSIFDSSLITLSPKTIYRQNEVLNLYDHTVHCLATAIAWRLFLYREFGIPRSYSTIWLISNGKKATSTVFSAWDVIEMLEQENHHKYTVPPLNVVFVGIQNNGNNDYIEIAKRMGVCNGYIIDVLNDAKYIRHTISRPDDTGLE